MPLNGTLSIKRLYFFGIFAVVWVLSMYGFFAVAVSDPVPSSTSMDRSSGFLQVNSPAAILDYSTMVTDRFLESSTIVLNGTITNLIELSADSTVVLLPEDRLALKSADMTSLLPLGSTLTFYEDKPVVFIPEQSEVFAVSSVMVSPLYDFTAKTSFIQSVQELEVYTVQVVFFELVKEHPDLALVNYRIYWGDGTEATYDADVISASHVYKKSGPYILTVVATDELGFTYVTSREYTVDYEGHLVHSYFWVRTNQTPLTAGFMSLGLLLFGFVGFTESGRYKLLVLFAFLLPFYSRMQKEDVLDQFVRGQIYGFIKTNPGTHYTQIRRQVGVKNGTLSYHLGVLEKTELIQSRREGLKYRAFYPTGMNFPKVERFRLTELQIRIVECIRSRPGMTQKQIAALLLQKPQTIHYNVKVLGQAGLIDVVRKGRKTICYPGAEQPM